MFLYFKIWSRITTSIYPLCFRWEVSVKLNPELSVYVCFVWQRFPPPSLLFFLSESQISLWFRNVEGLWPNKFSSILVACLITKSGVNTRLVWGTHRWWASGRQSHLAQMWLLRQQGILASPLHNYACGPKRNTKIWHPLFSLCKSTPISFWRPLGLLDQTGDTKSEHWHFRNQWTKMDWKGEI